MKKLLFFVLILLLTLNCNRVPISGRKQINFLPEFLLMDMSLANYRQFLNENKISTKSSDVKKVKRVGNNIAKAVEDLLKANKRYKKRIKDYQWEFNLVENQSVNAWAMPGGKIVVYSGILPITKDETGLAVVMGHEIAHAIARHGNERMSQQLIMMTGGIALSVAMTEKPEETRKRLTSLRDSRICRLGLDAYRARCCRRLTLRADERPLSADPRFDSDHRLVS